MKKSVLLCMLMFGLSLQFVKANGIVASNVSLQGQNITNQTWQVQFDLSWNNSWRDGINYDAAWVFIKFRIHTGPWTHAIINTSGFSTGTGTGTELRISPDFMGAIVNRSANGSGTYAVTGMQLQWNYGVSNVQNTDLPQVRVFAIEMVQIPEGPFAIGDGNGSSESLNALGVADNKWYMVTTELSPPLRADAVFSNGNNILRIDGDGGVDNNGDGIIDNANYPVGYKAFFMMKYEITQEQYADFLTTLLPTQSAPRYQITNTRRYTIQSSGGLFFTSRGDRACNYMSWADGIAYSDWAGLRPFTETEFEKACRGQLAPVLNEFAWGSTSYSPSYSDNTNNNSTRTVISGSEDGTETTTLSTNNFHSFTYYFISTHTYAMTGGDGGDHISTSGPVRVGLHVESSGGTRQSGGLSYYGVVDLSGNLSEQMINITTINGRQFTGTHGNGEIDANGNANVSGWPSSGNGYKGAGSNSNYLNNTASNVRFGDLLPSLYVSDRRNMQTLLGRMDHAGFRCARSQWW
jgi:formylglycine-generating enzyme required for sulfatase activity